jgi:hypothetical protein
MVILLFYLVAISLMMMNSLKCPVVAHWGCLAGTQRDEILKAARDKDRAEYERSRTQGEADKAEISNVIPAKRPGLNVHETTEFTCGMNLTRFHNQLLRPLTLSCPQAHASEGVYVWAAWK